MNKTTVLISICAAAVALLNGGCSSGASPMNENEKMLRRSEINERYFAEMSAIPVSASPEEKQRRLRQIEIKAAKELNEVR